MTTFEKVSSFLLILTATIIGCLVVTYLIKYFFIVLGFCFNHPAEAIIAIIFIGIAITSLPIGKEGQ
jgi:branched-subunit amino acid transport protein